MPTTPNMGMNQTQQGVTAGPAYATQIDANWVTLDNHDHSAGKGVRITPPGININADLSLGGNNLTNGAQLNGTSAHVNSVVATAALTLTSSATAAATCLITNNTITNTSGKLASFQNNSVEKVSLDFAGNIVAGTYNTLTVAAGGLTVTAATTSLTLKGNSAAAGPATIADSTVGLTGTARIMSFRNNANEVAYIRQDGALFMATGLIDSFNGVGITLLSTVSTALTAVTTNNTVTLTAGGKCLSIQNNGTEEAFFNFDGMLNLSNNATVTATLASTGITTKGNAAAAGVGLTINNGVTLTTGAGGKIVSFQNNGAEQAMVNAIGGIATQTHFLSAGTPPTVGTFNAGLGSVTGNSITGGDAAGIITFTTGTGSLIGANSALMTVTLANAYQSANFVCMAAAAQAAGILSTTGYYAVPASASTFVIYNLLGITPGTTTQYKLQFTTAGAGVGF